MGVYDPNRPTRAEYLRKKEMGRLLGKAWVEYAVPKNSKAYGLLKVAPKIYADMYSYVTAGRGRRGGEETSYKAKWHERIMASFSVAFGKYRETLYFNAEVGKSVSAIKPRSGRAAYNDRYYFRIGWRWIHTVFNKFYIDDNVPDALVLSATRVKANAKEFDLYQAEYFTFQEKKLVNGYLAVNRHSKEKRCGVTPQEAIRKASRAVVANISEKLGA